MPPERNFKVFRWSYLYIYTFIAIGSLMSCRIYMSFKACNLGLFVFADFVLRADKVSYLFWFLLQVVLYSPATMEGFHSKAVEAAASGDQQAETTPAHSKPSATAPPPGRLSQELNSLDLIVILCCPINFLWDKSGYNHWMCHWGQYVTQRRSLNLD